jgi:hypothetical protein
MSVERRASGSSRDMVTAPKTRLVQKQPHLLAYITPAEAALLKKNGGTGEMVNGIPAFRPVKGKTSRGKSSAGSGFSGGSSGGSSSSSSSSRRWRWRWRWRSDSGQANNPPPSGGGNNNSGGGNNNSGGGGGGGGGSDSGQANNPPPNDGPSAAEKAAAAAKAVADAKAAADRRAKAAAEAKAVADAKAASDAKAAADRRAKAEAEAKAVAEAKAAAKAVADAKAAADRRAKAEAEAKAVAAAEAKAAKEAAELKAAADRRAKAEAEAKADAKVAEEKRIKDQLAADAKKAKAALAVEKAPAIAKGKYLPAGSTTDKRGLTMDTTQNPRLDKNGNVVSAEDAKYLNFMDMIDGGGPGRAGPEFQTKRQAKDSPTGGEKTGTVATWIGATPLNSGIQPTGIAGFVNSGGIIGSIMNSVLGPDTRTEEEKAAALLLQQQQMDRDNNRDSDQIRIPPNPVDPAPPVVPTDPLISTPISSGMYGNVGQVSAQDLMVGGNQTSQELLNAPRALPTGEIPFSEPTQEEMLARIAPQGYAIDPNGPADQLASIYGPPGQVDPRYPGVTPYQVGPQIASVYGQPVNGTLPGSYNPLAAQQAAPMPGAMTGPTFADLYGGGQQQLPGQPYYGIMG